MSVETEMNDPVQTAEMEGAEAARKVFRWVLTLTILMLLTSGISFLISKIS